METLKLANQMFPEIDLNAAPWYRLFRLLFLSLEMGYMNLALLTVEAIRKEMKRKEDMEKLRVEIYNHNIYSCGIEYPCVICGFWRDQDLTAASLMPEGKTNLREDSYGDICPTCLEAGPTGAALRCREYAEDLEKTAKALYSLANDIEAITEDNWKTPEDLEAETKRIYQELAKEDPGYAEYFEFSNPF